MEEKMMITVYDRKTADAKIKELSKKHPGRTFYKEQVDTGFQEDEKIKLRKPLFGMGTVCGKKTVGYVIKEIIYYCRKKDLHEDGTGVWRSSVYNKCYITYREEE